MKNRQQLSPMGAALAARFQPAASASPEADQSLVPASPGQAAAAVTTDSPPATPDEETP